MTYQILATMLRSATPLALLGLAGLFAFRSGIFHLGLEGLVITGAFVTVAAGHATGSVAAGVLIAMLVCMALSVLYWVVIEPLRADMIIAGLGLTSIGLGGTAFALFSIYDARGRLDRDIALPRPVRGITEGAAVVISELSILVWITPVVVFAAWIVLCRSRFGLQLSAVGEYPEAARSVGVNPSLMKLKALLIGGALSALAGAELSAGSLTQFSEGMSAGRGFIALVAVIFGASHPIGVGLAALFFGLAQAVGIQLQLNISDTVPPQFVLMIPYVITIVAVWLAGLWRKRSLEAEAGYSELRNME